MDLGVGCSEQQADPGAALCFVNTAAAAAACFGARGVVVALRPARLGLQVQLPDLADSVSREDQTSNTG